MKTLFLLRHARVANAASGSSDLDRELNDRGREESRVIGAFIKKQGLKFDLFCCSPAVRAQQTTAEVLAAAELSSSVRYDERIYEASPFRLLEVISEFEPEVNAALLVGHNPGMEELLRMLTGLAQHLTTATLVQINLNAAEWNKIADDPATLEWIVTPHALSQDPN